LNSAWDCPSLSGNAGAAAAKRFQPTMNADAFMDASAVGDSGDADQ
jgi:hypothetical protein